MSNSRFRSPQISSKPSSTTARGMNGQSHGSSGKLWMTGLRSTRMIGCDLLCYFSFFCRVILNLDSIYFLLVIYCEVCHPAASFAKIRYAIELAGYNRSSIHLTVTPKTLNIQWYKCVSAVHIQNSFSKPRFRGDATYRHYDCLECHQSLVGTL